MRVTIHFSVIEHADYVELVRTSVPFDIEGDLFARCAPTFELLSELKHLGMLIDLRGVAQRVDQGFEIKIKRVRQELVKGHPRVALLVQTPVGRLQVSRQLREDGAGSHIRVFSDAEPARAFAGGVLDARPLPY